jgi:hypothetical protein
VHQDPIMKWKKKALEAQKQEVFNPERKE